MTWRRWLRKEDQEANLDRELSYHIEETVSDLVRSGMSEEQARRQVRLEFGGAEQVKEVCRDVRPARWMDTFQQDIRYTARNLRRNPGFAAVAIATLALGIGGITAMFSAFDAILIRPLPYADADRLVMIWDDMGKKDAVSRHAPAPAELIEWRRLNTVFTDLAATQPTDVTISGDAQPEQVHARKATWNLWSVLGSRPLLGRAFTEEEDLNGARVVVISYGLWQRRFGGSPDVLGRKIIVNDEPSEVIGVTRPEFYFLPARDIDIWTPASFPASLRRNFTWHDLNVVARLKPGVALDHARQSMAAVSRQITAKDFRGPHSVFLRPLREDMTGNTQTALIVLLCASAALLLIACVNLANLLLSRGAARGREVAVRSALGAGRARLLAQFLTESLVLAGLGSVGGLALALPAMRYLGTLAPEAMGVVRLNLDWRVLAFSALVAIAATLMFGLMPALRRSRFAPQDGLREGGRGSFGPRSQWFQHSLIVVETALAVMLLTSGGLLLHTLQQLRKTDLGVRTEKLLTLETPLFRYPDFDKRAAFVNAELESIRAIPGVVNAGATSRIPLTETAQASFYLLAGQPRDRISQQVALFRMVSRDYLATIAANLREGRFFENSDRRSDAPVAIVNETFANRNFPGQSALGKQFKFGQLNDKAYWYTIVGVLRDVRDRGVTEEQKPTAYILHDQADQWSTKGAWPTGIVVRAAVEPASIASAVRQAIWSVDKNQPVWRIQTLDDIVDRQLSTPAQSSTLMTAFAVLALLLASVGLYGVLSYTVTQRRNEIGVRMALGATSGQILLSFGKRGLTLTLAGLAIGAALAAISVRFMSSLLYGVRPDYLITVATVSAILLAVAALACFVPARNASRVDPVAALRSE